MSSPTRLSRLALLGVVLTAFSCGAPRPAADLPGPTLVIQVTPGGGDAGEARAGDKILRAEFRDRENLQLEVTDAEGRSRCQVPTGLGNSWEGTVSVWEPSAARIGIVLSSTGWAKAFDWNRSTGTVTELWNPEWSQGADILFVDWENKTLLTANNNTDKELDETFEIELALWQTGTRTKTTVARSRGTLDLIDARPGVIRYRIAEPEAATEERDFTYEP